MKNNIKKILAHNSNALENSEKRLCDIYEIMFSNKNILCESNDGYRIKKETYSQIKAKTEKVSAGLYEKVGANHDYIALEMENSPEWIVAFWAILKSGNKPYLVNTRYPSSLTNNILKTLEIKYTVCCESSNLETESLLISELCGETAPDLSVFEDEIAFSSSATSMNEVICFYTGLQISEQILNFKDIIKREPRMAKHYKGELKQLAFLPFYHIFGLFAVYFWFTFFGSTLVFLRDYSAQTIQNTCRRHAVTHVFAVPALWHTVEKSIISAAKDMGEHKYNEMQKALKFCTKLQNIFPRIGPSIAKSIMGEITDKVFGKSIIFCINGGSYIKDSALELLNGIGYCTYNGYGMSEIGITSVELRRKPKWRNQNSIGMPFTSVEYKIDDEGILLVRGSSLCVKKLKNGKEEKFDGWFRTGDKMECRDGSYYILGRESDVVIGENGENINPDLIEKLFTLNNAKALSVLGLDGENGQELSLVLEVGEFVSQSAIDELRANAYAINDTLDKACAIKKFYFTNDNLCPPTAIKVSRQQLYKKIKDGEVTLIPFSSMKSSSGTTEDSKLSLAVKEIICEVLKAEPEKVHSDTHIFYDLGATSIQYFSILSALSEKFSISNYKKTDTYCYTLKEICEYIEKHI